MAASLAGGGASAQCRQALALGLDVSGSVDPAEYRLQLDGLAAALTSAEVAAALLARPGAPVAVAVFEWSGPGGRRAVAPWTDVTDAAALGALADRLRATRRSDMASSTAIGGAIAHGAGLLAARPDCGRWTLDLSGDGRSNTGPAPGEVAALGVTINGLVIATDDRGTGAPSEPEGIGIAELSAYYRAEVIRGPGAFVETALGYEGFEAAMTRKLLRELRDPAFAGQPSRVGTSAGSETSTHSNPSAAPVVR